MRSSARVLSLFVLALSASAAALVLTIREQGASNAQSGGDAAPVLERMAERYRELRTLRAELQQQKFYDLLDLSDPIESGTLEVERRSKGMSVRLEMRTPQKRVLVVHDGEYVLYQPEINQAILGKAKDDAASGSNAFLRYLVGDLSDVEEDFVVESLGSESIDDGDDGAELIHLRMIPKDREQVPYRSIDLWVDPALHLPVREELVEPNGDRIVIRLHDVQLNEPIDDSRFRLDLPEGVEKVRG